MIMSMLGMRTANTFTALEFKAGKSWLRSPKKEL